MSRPEIHIEHLAQLHHLIGGNALSAKAQKKLQAILLYLENSQSMEQSAKNAGVTVSALRRWINAFDPQNPQLLEEKSRRPKKVRSSEMSSSAAALVRSFRQASPRIGKEEISRKILLEQGEKVSASSIGRYIERECLYFADCPLHRKKRLHALMKQSSQAQQPSLQTTIIAVSKPASERSIGMKRWMKHGVFIFLILSIALFSMMANSLSAHASSIGIGNLVNTEAFAEIDDGDLASDIELRFGTTGESIRWDILKTQFVFTDDVHVTGELTGSGALAIDGNIRTKANMTLNSDNDTNNAVLTFGNSTLAQSLSFIHSSQKFRFSTSLDIAGAMSGYSLTVSGLNNCDTIDTNANGVLSCGTDSGAAGGLSISDADPRYVNVSGDTMTGALVVQNGNTHTPTSSPLLKVRGTVSGALLRANNMTVSGAVVYSSGSALLQSAKGASGQLLLSQGTSAPKWASPIGGMIWYFDGTQAVTTSKGPQITMPMSMTLSSVSLSAKGAPTGAALIYDIHLNGTTIFSTRPQINAGQTTGGGSAVFSTVDVPTNSSLTIDIDQVGSTFAGSGVTIMLNGTRKY